jgi:hypothetical protein
MVLSALVEEYNNWGRPATVDALFEPTRRYVSVMYSDNLPANAQLVGTSLERVSLSDSLRMVDTKGRRYDADDLPDALAYRQDLSRVHTGIGSLHKARGLDGSGLYFASFDRLGLDEDDTTLRIFSCDDLPNYGQVGVHNMVAVQPDGSAVLFSNPMKDATYEQVALLSSSHCHRKLYDAAKTLLTPDK